MAKRGPNELVVKFSSTSSTGSFRDITQQVYDFSGWAPEAILEAAHTFGDTFEESLFVGVSRIPAVTISGPYDDDTTTGTAGLFSQTTDLGAERVMRLGFVTTTGTTGAGNLLKVEVIVQAYKRMPRRGSLTPYELVVQPTGAFAFVTTT